ncbi:hypothetical protein [Fodinicurvata halophila]|uniref:hypothetical protein n=1 Tax=Fodinicurvata halophila TaxID=1419723 RepID=UPI003629F1B2
MLSDFMKALGILTDPESRRVMRLSFGLTLLTFIVLWISATFGLSAFGEYLYHWADAQGWGNSGWASFAFSMPRPLSAAY